MGRPRSARQDQGRDVHGQAARPRARRTATRAARPEPPARLRHRRRLQRDRRREGALPRRGAVRLLREGQRGRRQLGLRQPQRAVGLLRDARDQHLLPADGVLGLPDARGLPAVRRAPPGPRLLRGVRRPLRLPPHDHLRHLGRGGDPQRRRQLAGPDRRVPTARRPGSTPRCWSPTATTGTRAGRSRRTRATSRASRSTPTTTARPPSWPAATWSSSGWATPPSTSPSRPRRWPAPRRSRCAVASG